MHDVCKHVMCGAKKAIARFMKDVREAKVWLKDYENEAFPLHAQLDQV